MDPYNKICKTVDALFGNGVAKLIPKNLDFEYSRKNGRIKSVFHEGKLLCTLRIDGGLAITVYMARLLIKSKKFRENCLSVDLDSKPFVEEGKSVFCNHVKFIGKNIEIGAEVPVLFNNKVIAVGKAVLASDMIKSQKRGVAVKIRDSLKSQFSGDRSI